MTIQEQAIKEFEIEIQHFRNYQISLLKSPVVSGASRSFDKTSDIIAEYQDYIDEIPNMSSDEIISLLLNILEVNENGELT